MTAETGGRCCICAGQTLNLQSPDGSTFSAWDDVMAAILSYYIISEFRPRHSMSIYPKNNRAVFQPDPIWNDGAWGFLKTVVPTTSTNNNKMSSDMR